jgi:CheY-like chemotaxis protein
MSHILIVDDDAPVRGMTATVLNSAGYTTSQAANGEEALVLMAETPPDLVLLDVHMGAMDGQDVLARIQASSAVPVVIITATANPELRAKLVQDGAVACLGKPFRNRDLREVVATALGHPQGPH